ncbi:hypothetical protein ECG_08355 [Echinococcus granulosus]|nr:hypothetical protein ECG_08355 [Echinococcus granulosus]
MEEFEQWLFAVLSPDSDNSLSLVPAPHNLPFYEVFYGPTSQEAEMMDLKRNVDPPLIGAVHHALCNPDDPLPFQKSAVREPSVQATDADAWAVLSVKERPSPPPTHHAPTMWCSDEGVVNSDNSSPDGVSQYDAIIAVSSSPLRPAAAMDMSSATSPTSSPSQRRKCDGSGEGGGRTGDVSVVSEADNGGVIDVDQSTSSSSVRSSSEK